MKIKKRYIVLVTLILVFAVAFFIDRWNSKHGLDNVDWEIISSQSYVRDGQQCMGYRVYINADDANNSAYRAIFQEVTDDGKYLHTVWFYFIKSHADGTHTANIIMEETASGVIPTPTK